MCTSDYHLYGWCHGSQKGVSQTLELEVQASGSCCVGAKTELGSLEEQPVFLADELSLQSCGVFFPTCGFFRSKLQGLE